MQVSVTQHGAVAPARRRGLADEVADRIREAIFSGVYIPGAQLREVELSGVMQVSRGPVREALRVLEGEGLVHCAWHRGSTVTALSPEDVAELHSLRGALEDLAVRRVVAHSDAGGLAVLDEVATRMEGVVDAHELVRLDIAFHDEVFAAARHRRLAAAWDGIRCQVHLFLLTRIGRSSQDYLTRIPEEHRALLAALRAGDDETALSLFAAHRRLAVDVVTADPEEGPSSG